MPPETSAGDGGRTRELEIRPFRDVVSGYRAVFFDAYGVLKNHRGVIPGIEHTFAFLRERAIDFYVLTNDASRSPAELARAYQDAGLTQINEGKIISSGMLAREYLRAKVKSGLVAYAGTPVSAHYVETTGIKTISIRDLTPDHYDDVRAMVFLDDEGFDWVSGLGRAINLLRARTIPTIVANTDRVYPVSSNEVAVAVGALANLVENVVDKRFIRFGKPDAQMFNFALEHIRGDAVRHPKSDILMVGDTLHTDIIGGNHFGIDTALVLSGNTPRRDALLMMEATGILPDYVCKSVLE
jgi:HAD superfamily hydrolase (TIGR01450 family)